LTKNGWGGVFGTMIFYDQHTSACAYCVYKFSSIQLGVGF